MFDLDEIEKQLNAAVLAVETARQHASQFGPQGPRFGETANSLRGLFQHLVEHQRRILQAARHERDQAIREGATSNPYGDKA